MPNIPFSVNALKQLERQLNALAKELPGDIRARVEIAVAEEVAPVVRQNISAISDPDGNYAGSDNPEAAVTIRVGYKSDSYQVLWQGHQIAYLEFGTGAAGASQPYPGPAMTAANYMPDPTKEQWVYLDDKSGEPTISRGIAPYAPMYNAAVQMRIAGNYQNARKTWRKAVNDALTV